LTFKIQNFHSYTFQQDSKQIGHEVQRESNLCLYVPKKSLELNFVSFVTNLGAYWVCKVNLALEQIMKAQEGSKNLDACWGCVVETMP